MSPAAFHRLEPGDVLQHTVTAKAVQADGSACDLRGELVEITVTAVHRNQALGITRVEGLITGGGRIQLRVMPEDFGDPGSRTGHGLS